MAVIIALIDAFMFTFIMKKAYRMLLAYGCIIGGMKYNDENKDLPVSQWKPNHKWEGELPSIYNLDDIVEAMNHQRDGINHAFKLNVDMWSRPQVKALMDGFEKLHRHLSEYNGKEFTLMEVCNTIMSFIDKTYWQRFKEYYALSKEASKQLAS